ncbi:unnamed protein product [Danaus chrysippus]|uniref:(African queen) hypothetical protein n=1 Tax=Danaus chrysippus TaxID=151541 RepID=A0A8J2R6E0_9NEOP|nr:unnamed protein product [Danaus chrysippus]
MSKFSLVYYNFEWARLTRNGVEVRLQWIPSHVGVRGNEVADSLASKALRNGIPLDITTHNTDHFPKIKNENYIKFKSYFNECSQNRGLWYRSIVDEPPRKPWFASRNLNRKYLTICFRTRTYHIPLNKFNFIMKKRDDPNCKRCEREEDLLHLVLECKINEKSRSLEYKQVPMKCTDVVLLVVNSNVKHQLTGSEYPQRRAQCQQAADELGKPSLRSATGQDLARRLFHQSHESLSKLMGVSCPEFDQLVDIVRSSDGVFGARMTGGGFGECVIALVKKECLSSIKSKVRAEYKGKPVFFECEPSDGARILKLE